MIIYKYDNRNTPVPLLLGSLVQLIKAELICITSDKASSTVSQTTALLFVQDAVSLRSVNCVFEVYCPSRITVP